MAQPKPVSAHARRESPLTRSLNTILLVEDEEVVRTILRLALAHRGYHVLEASDVNQASQLWHENADSIDLLITDHGLGRESPSGLELAKQLKELNPNLKVLITTGGLAAELKASFHCYFLEKPFGLSLLATTVRRALDEAPREKVAI